ncbi:MAG: SpoIIE family protein phosphatase [Sedimentisphaerales bacterium]|nr:SpoIIE family protein phosphatase [Sedimentisphaerales bacterium]
MESQSIISLRTSFTDVLYLTDKNLMPLGVKKLLDEKKLSYSIVRVKDFAEVRENLDLVGTVVIDAENATCSQRVVQIIELLETKNISVILLTDCLELPEENSCRSSSTVQFSLDEDAAVFSLDELWVRISANLSYRKKNSAQAAKPVKPSKKVKVVYKNKLAEQMNMAKALVDNLAEQLRLAGLVQKDFLPSRLPDSDRLKWGTIFLPAEWVSGDIYDVVRLDEEHIGFYLADVVGHGMPAALLTIFLKQALVMRQTVDNNYRIFSPSEVITNLNVRMAAQKLSGYQFATCCYCLLNTRTLELTYARAGHPYPVLMRAGRQPEQLEIRGSLLGVFEQAEFPQKTIQLQTGDKLLLYSDGADSLIGGFNDRAGFCFTKEFSEIKHLPVIEMLDILNFNIQNQEVMQAEVDDITMVGLEILK